MIQHTKSIFARHGIPEVVISDNGPQYSGEAYRQFAQEYRFQHITSSLYYPQSNGEAERAVGTVKRLLNKENDPYLAILSYRSTPLQNGYSPSELLMNRKLRMMVPITREQRKPKVPDQQSLRAREEIKRNQKKNFDMRHRVRDLPDLEEGTVVWIPDRQTEAVVKEEVAPRSYTVSSPDGTVRRNRRDLVQMPESNPSSETDTQNAVPQTQGTVKNVSEPMLRRSTRVSHPIDRLKPSCS